jgi:hypothetical protein
MSDGSNLPVPFDREVGYGKPPVEHRFRKGRSGNPRGRPRKGRAAPAVHENRLPGSHEPTTLMILEEAYRTVKVRDGDRVVEMPVNQAVMRSMLQNALKGSRLAQRDFTLLLRTIEAEQKQTQQAYFEAMATYKWDAEAEIARCQQLGIAPPEMIPHPDDLFIDARNGIARIRGPFTPEEKLKWDKVLEQRNDAAEAVAYAALNYRRTRTARRKDMWLREWKLQQRIFDIINDKLPERYQITLEHRGYGAEFSKLGEHASFD